MSVTVFLAVLAAALLHAVWNALVKGGQDKHVSMAAIVLGHLPFACAILPFVPAPSAESLPYLACGIALHLGYQLVLLNAYRIGDLTQVYPIARGSAPLIVAATSVFFLKTPLQWGELLAIVVISCSIASLALVRHGDGQRNLRAAMLSLCTGCFIAAYSLVDGLGARVAGTALGFYGWLAIGNAASFAVLIYMRSPALLARLPVECGRLALIGGGSSFAAYALVVWCFTQAPIALVAALRETSIMFALIIGVVFLKEPLNLAKLFAIVGALFGAILVRLTRA